jgi:hypothetical protein
VDTPGCFHGWGLFFVYIDMSTNLQPIPLGLIAIQPYLDFVCVKGFSPIEPGDTTYQNDAFINPPSVFVDGLLLTYVPVLDKRYISFNGANRTIEFNNGTLMEGETVQIFL